MLSFKQYLAEAKNPDLSGFMKNAQLMLDKDILLFRGTESKKQEFVIGTDDELGYSGYIGQQRTVERRAKGSKVASRLAATWEIPNRQLSVFATRDADHAADFGYELLMIIPADDVSLYGWSATDFNQGSNKLPKMQIHALEGAMTNIFRNFEDANPDTDEDPISVLMFKGLAKAGVTTTELREFIKKPESPEACALADVLVSMLPDFEKQLEKIENNKDVYLAMYKRQIVREIGRIKDALDTLKVFKVRDAFAAASPELFKIKTFSDLADIPKKLSTSDELWFNGKFLAINLDGRHTAYSDGKQALRLLLKKD